MRKSLLILSVSLLLLFNLGCTKVVTLPVRTVIDLTEPPVRVKNVSTIDLLAKPELDKPVPSTPSLPEGK